MDVLTSSSASGKKNHRYDKVLNGSSWGVYKEGKLVTTINGKIMPTKATVKRQLFLDNLLKSIKNLFTYENE